MLTLLEKPKQGPEESVMGFADSLRTLSRYSGKGRNGNDALLLHFFMKGLRKEPREFVLFRRPTTFEEAVAEGEYFEDQFVGGQVRTTFTPATTQPQVDTPPATPRPAVQRAGKREKELDPAAVADLTRQMGRLSLPAAWLLATCTGLLLRKGKGLGLKGLRGCLWFKGSRIRVCLHSGVKSREKETG